MAKELSRIGVNCEILCGSARTTYGSAMLKLPFHDILYIQKKYTGKDILLNKISGYAGKKTIFDIDDAPGGLSLSSGAERSASEMMKAATAVVVGSHNLRDFARQFSKAVYLVPSAVDLDYYKPDTRKRAGKKIVLGWSGNGIAYKNDLQMLIPPLKLIGKKYAIKLIIIGALGQKEISRSFSALQDIEIDVIDSVDWSDPLILPSLISQFDIGLYPLLDNEYNRYKCGYKSLEYMAAEVPTVGSPVSETRHIIEDGIDGFLAAHKEEWVEKICCLIEDRELRRSMGEAGRKKVEERYSLKGCAYELKKVFNKI